MTTNSMLTRKFDPVSLLLRRGGLSFPVLVISRLRYRPNTAKLLKRICSVPETLVSYLNFES